jgi:hypothetical protein
MSEQTQQTGAPTPTQQGGPASDQSHRAGDVAVKMIDDASYDKLSLADQQRFVRQRDDNNDSICAERQATDAQQQTDGATRVKLSNGIELTEQQVSNLLRFKGEHETRIATLPATAADYKLDVGA